LPGEGRVAAVTFRKRDKMKREATDRSKRLRDKESLMS
jgi:hypothetical protein